MRRSFISSLLVLASFSGVFALPAPAAAQQVDTSRLEALGITVESIEKTSVDGLYQVISSQGVLYLSADGKRLLAGNLFDLTSNGEPVNLTEQRMSVLRRQQIAEMEDEMIVYPAADEKYKITIFTDTTCGYCQRLHENLDSYLERGITVRYLAFPRGGMNSKGGRELQNAWCADDPAAALTTIKAGDRVDSPNCDNPVAKHYRIGQVFGVTGTPAIVMPDGRLLPGLRTADALLAEMTP